MMTTRAHHSHKHPRFYGMEVTPRILSQVLFLVFSDTLVLILGIVGACLLVLIIFVVLICVRRRAKGKESIHTKWMINYNEIAQADDTEDHPMVLGNLHHMNSSEGLVEPTYLFFFSLVVLLLFILLLFVWVFLSGFL